MKKWILLLVLLQFLVFKGHGQSSSYVNHTELGPLIGELDGLETRVNFSFQTFNGVKIHPNHSLGFLVGVDSYPGFTLMPLAIGWRGVHHRGERTSPFASLDLGYGSALLAKRQRENLTESWYAGGLLISPAIGLQRKSRSGRHAFSWSIGFKRQKASFYEGQRIPGLSKTFPDPVLPPGFQSIKEESYLLNSLFIKWGIVF